jgi:hypothetical protein
MRSRSLLISLSFLSLLAACADSALEAGSNSAANDDSATSDDVELAAPVDIKADRAVQVQSASDTSTFYNVKVDTRRCAWPNCGGYWVSRVNFPTTKCDDGVVRDACYVVNIDLENGIGLTGDEANEIRSEIAANRVVLRGQIKPADYGTQKLGFFVPTEGWRSATTQASSAVVYKVTDKHVDCFAAPCMRYTEGKLNSTTSRTISQLDFSTMGLSSTATQDAMVALSYDGLLVAGSNHAYNVSARVGTSLSAAQYWTKVRPTTDLLLYTATSSDLKSRELSDLNVQAPQVPRTYSFGAGNSVTVEDSVAPCPPGAMCIWSGIVTRSATFTVSGDQIQLTYSGEAAPAGHDTIRYFNTLLTRKNYAGELVVLEQGDDGGLSGRQFR